MGDARLGAVQQYQVTLDRAGHAIAAGGLAVSTVATGVLFASGVRDTGSLLSAAFVSAFLGIVAIVAVGGPIWLALHALGRRGPAAAAGAGFGAALLLALFAVALMPANGGGMLERAVAAIATVLGVGGIGAGVALLMWRIAYRPAGTLSRP